MAIWKLTIEDDEGQKTVVPLVRDEYTIGRREGHTIRLTEQNVSRDHARIHEVSDHYVIEDLGSYNGVFVNGQRLVEATKLRSGDFVMIGDFRIEAHDDGAAARVARPSVPTTSEAPKSPGPVSTPVSAPFSDRPARLVLLTGNEAGKEIPLDKPRLVLGRGEDVDVRLNHSSVSRHHCELRVSDDGYDVIDLASANGLRINGEEVKHAGLTSGDLLELGDAQLQYVGAGQPFVFDAATAEAARLVEARRNRHGSGALTWTMLVLAVVVIAGGAMVLVRQSERNEAARVPRAADEGANAPLRNRTTPDSQSDELLARALVLKEKGDLVGAHAQVSTIASDSPLRQDARFVEIENAWADHALKNVSAADDVDEKRERLREVLRSGADQSHRTTASRLLDELERHTAPSAASAEAASGAGGVGSTPIPFSTAGPQGTAAVTGVTGNCPSWRGDYTRAMREKDFECVRTMLMPRLTSGAISTGEARYLHTACAALGDVDCQKSAAAKL